MGTPYLGEIKIISWGYNPKSWAYCNGQFLPINQNQALFSLLGTQYGGNGQTTFALPDTRGRTAMHMGGAHATIGEKGGTETVALTAAQTPSHIHFLQGVAAQASLVGGAIPAATKSLGQGAAASTPVSDVLLYGTGATNVPMSPASVTMTGQGQPHENRQPYLVLAHIIALQGVFPSRN